MTPVNAVKGAARGLVAGALLLTVASQSLAQENISVDANIFWDNGIAYVGAGSAGNGCPEGGGLTTGQLVDLDSAPGVFDNEDALDPQLVDPFNLASPDFSPALGSPAVAPQLSTAFASGSARIVRVWDVDPFFNEVCYAGTTPPQSPGNWPHLQAHLGTDDPFEWFGGTARAKWLVATGGDDDGFDWQMGYRGRLQFGIYQQAGGAIAPNQERGIEADNNEFDNQCDGRSNPIFANLTMVGFGPNGTGTKTETGFELRRGTAGTVVNSIVTGFDEGIALASNVIDNCAGPAIAVQECADVCDSLVVDGNITSDNGVFAASNSGGAACWHGTVTTDEMFRIGVGPDIYDNRIVSDLLLGDPYNIDAPNWNPQNGSPALAGNPGNRENVAIWDVDPWFTPVCYVGAVGYDNDWYSQWIYTNYDNGTGRTDINLAWPDSNLTTIAVNTTLSPGTNYVLTGRVDVQPGATLTVEAGSQIRGLGAGTYLVVERAGQLDFRGTAAAPIILTSNGAPGSQFAGDWGGVVINGRAVANCASADGCGLTTVDGDCDSEGGAGFFGGSDDQDDSGSIRYARVEYAGETISPNNELNAWTFNAVGSSTVIEYLQAHLGTDDLFEWFGGTASCKYLVGTGGDDDGFDWQMGFRGRLQFGIAQQAGGAIAPNQERGIEADNNEFDNQCAGRSCPTFSNLTLVGFGTNGTGTKTETGAELRRGTAGTLVNSLILGYDEAFGIADNVLDNCAVQTPLPLEDCGNKVITGIGDGVTPALGGFVVAAAPNPVRGAASIYFSLDNSEKVRVQVFDLNGHLVDTLMDGTLSAGDQRLNWDAARAASGVYFYQVVTASGQKASGKLVVSR